MSKTKIQRVRTPVSETLPRNDLKIEAGQWYWVNVDKADKWFGCVTHVGSNYAEISDPHGSHVRVHFDEFGNHCKLESDPDLVINTQISSHQSEVNRLLERVHELAQRLNVSTNQYLSSGSETFAMVRVTSSEPVEDYKSALIRAKTEELPDLFKQIKSENEELAAWMSAKILPMKAKTRALHGIIDSVNDRIFSVELYAGLSETIERIADGAPASIDTKIHLMQRRHYMDEECLAHYDSGGMTFKDVSGFDKWLARPENMNRILPFPRTVVAFKVRRKSKEREIIDISDYFRIIDEKQADQATFLYIRNAEQLYRMRTEIEFPEKLFPDLDKSRLEVGKLWAYKFGSHVDKDKPLITDNEYKSLLEEDDKNEQEAKEKRKRLAARDRWRVFTPHRISDDYVPFDPSSVYYDDVSQKVANEIREHNRIGLVLQGLLDRSPVLHPHPPFQIWTDEGFRQALELVYDESRALVAGQKPDFEAYRQRLNASLKAGSITVGQQDAWEIDEAEKECKRRDRDYRNKSTYRPDRYKPYGNPGPGNLARISKYSPTTEKCTYEWERERLTRNDDSAGPIRVTFTTTASKILNVDAYKPGDFKQFFNDPRTRVEYLKWAPLLLEAEEYHAGNRKISDPPKVKKPVKSTPEGRRRYQNRKIRKALIGKAVRLIEPIETKGGKRYEIGSLWRVTGGHGREFSITGIKKDGSLDADRFVRGVYRTSLEVDLSV